MKSKSSNKLDRRSFLTKSGAAVVAGTILPGSVAKASNIVPADVAMRTLGRTGFQVNPVAIGGFCQNPNVYKRAMDMGVNHIDTAEGYYRGNSERTVGKAIQGRNRKELFISTKLGVDYDDTKESLLKRYRKCLERLDSDYFDALYMHGVGQTKLLEHEGFHALVDQMKAEGHLKHAGISCHGPEERDDESFEKILMATAADGRFDLMLFSYNFMNREEADRVISFCKEKNVGTVAMKTSPGIESPFGEDAPIEVIAPMDPENLKQEQEDFIKEAMKEDDLDRDEALAELEDRINEYNEGLEDIKPYLEKYGATTSEELRKVSLKWILENPDMHTSTITMASFSAVDTFVPLTGEALTDVEREMIRDYAQAFDNKYCRHGCSDCVEACPYNLPVSRIMRYTYYFRLHGREKYAMSKYNGMASRNASLCLTCDAPCKGACPYGLNIQAGLVKAHQTLTLA